MAGLLDRAYKAADKLVTAQLRIERMHNRLTTLTLVAGGCEVQEMSQAEAVRQLTVMVEAVEKLP